MLAAAPARGAARLQCRDAHKMIRWRAVTRRARCPRADAAAATLCCRASAPFIRRCRHYASRLPFHLPPYALMPLLRCCHYLPRRQIYEAAVDA